MKEGEKHVIQQSRTMSRMCGQVILTSYIPVARWDASNRGLREWTTTSVADVESMRVDAGGGGRWWNAPSRVGCIMGDPPVKIRCEDLTPS